MGLFRRTLVSFAIAALSAGMLTAVPAAAAEPEASYVVLYGANSQVHEEDVRATGGKVQADLSKAGLLAVRTSHPDAIRALPGVVGVAKDQPRFKTPDDQVIPVEDGSPEADEGCASSETSCGLQWDLARTHVSQAWNKTAGSAAVKVAVIDTGLTSSHQEVGSNYDKAESKSFVQPNPICPLDAATFQSVEDFNGHGTWTATHVAGVNGAFMTGIAPNATLVNIRVLGSCGFGFDSWVMAGMLYGNQIGAQVESMSLGGFMCGHGVVEDSFWCGTAAAAGNDALLWKAHRQLVSYLLRHGTLVVAAIGNDHVQIDSTGQVVSHGSLAKFAAKADPRNDLFGLTETPAGVPGVVAVAAVNRVNAGGAAGDTKFGQYGVGRTDQLTYYSSYGERIDVSAPGGARNYNVPNSDCLASACRSLGPSGPTATDNPGDFGAWGVKVDGSPCGNCYAFVQGTSMATPQVAGIAVLALSANPHLSPRALASLLRRSVTSFNDPNATPAIADEESMPTFNYSVAYGAEGVPNELMGRGVIDAARAVGASNGD